MRPKRSRALWLAWSAAIGVALTLAAESARAAALIGSGGTHPALTGETALIVWDPETRVEHLIVGARAERADGQIAYLLPTPTPASAEGVQGDLTTAFATLIKSYRARTPEWELPTLPGGTLRPWLTFGAQGVPDTTVLDARDPSSTVSALAARGYEDDAILRDWMSGLAGPAPHLVVIRDHSGGATRTIPYVRIQFETPRPFFPYREPSRPADDVEGSAVPGATQRLLRVYVLTTERVALRLGQSRASMSQAWLSYEPTHGELAEALGAALLAKLQLDPSKRWWLTSFEDYHLVRPGNDDAWFDRLGAIPTDGEPGTVGDRAQAGVTLSPLGPPSGTLVRPEGGSEAGGVEKVAGERSGSGIRGRGKTGVVFGLMIAMALGAWAWSTSKRV